MLRKLSNVKRWTGSHSELMTYLHTELLIVETGATCLVSVQEWLLRKQEGIKIFEYGVKCQKYCFHGI